MKRQPLLHRLYCRYDRALSDEDRRLLTELDGGNLIIWQRRGDIFQWKHLSQMPIRKLVVGTLEAFQLIETAGVGENQGRYATLFVSRVTPRGRDYLAYRAPQKTGDL
jgi:hypothetical protein